MIYVQLLMTVFLATQFAQANYQDSGEVSATLSNEEIPNLSAEVVDEQDEEIAEEEILIFDNSEDYDRWVEEQEAEVIGEDEEGNEFVIVTEQVVDNGKSIHVKKRKKRKIRKKYARNCVAKSGGASWYGKQFHGHKTANGEVFNQNALTAAHKTLRFNSIVRVTYKGRSVDVRINDAGPYVNGRVIDLSHEAAKRIGLTQTGHGYVQIQLIKCG